MTKILFASLPAYGHVYPMLPLAVACASAGHEVVFATGDPFLDALPVPTAVGITCTLQEAETETARDHPSLTGLDFAMHMFGETVAQHVEPLVRAVCERERPDLVVYEMLALGAPLAAARLGIRAVSFGLGLWNQVLLGRAYEIAGVDPSMPGGYLDQIPPTLQNPLPLPPRTQPIRPVAWAHDAPLPAWLPTSRRAVYVTLGTVSFGAVEVLRRAVLAVAEHDVEVLVAAGPTGDPALLGELPPNVHVEKFVPQAEVLRHVALVVHHGGAGTMLGALAEGLPQLILPQGADQPFNAMAIERAGAGRALTNDAQTPEALESAVGALLAEGPERLAAKRIAEEIAAMPPPSPALLGADSRNEG